MTGKRFGQLIKEERERKGISLRELERRTGRKHTQLYKIESGKTNNPGILTCSRIADALECEIIIRRIK